MVGSMNLEVMAAKMCTESEGDVVNIEAQIDSYYVESESGIAPIATRFCDASITVSRGSEGMEVTIVTLTDETASVIGVKDVKIKHKVWWGWETVATSSGGFLYNSSGISCSLVYKGAVQGDTYKISCVHYAEIDGYHELPSETTDFIYNF